MARISPIASSPQFPDVWVSLALLLGTPSSIWAFLSSKGGTLVKIGSQWSRNLRKKIQSWGFSWLNLAGKTMLIKFVLSSLLIFQFSAMLAPTSILKKMDEWIRRFFWKGGKQNDRKIPLISWDKVSKPLLEGGLHFKDPRTQNIAMGAKILWRQIALKLGWAQKALWKKYFRGQKLRSLDNLTHTNKGSQIHRLCMQALPLIQKHSY